MKQEKRLRKKEEDEGAFFDQKKPPSSRKNMLFQHDISFDKVQVTEDRKTPDAEEFPVQTCPMCGRRMHAHGWRTRFIVDIERKTTLIWVRRVYCPGCRKTGTILPKFVHALKLFSLEAIRKVLGHRIESGSKSGRFAVSRYLQERWWRSFCLKRSGGDARGPGEMVCPCGLPFLVELGDPGDFMYTMTYGGIPHHRLLLIYSAPPK